MQNIMQLFNSSKSELHSTPFESKEVFIVTDGFSTGEKIAPRLRSDGYDVIHVLSLKGAGLHIPHQVHDYIACFEETEDLDSLMEQLSGYNIRAVFPGADPGVELADKLSHRLELKETNDISLSKARRNKFLMHETLKKQGIRSVKQLLTNNESELINWVNNNGLPVVVKPPESAGTVGVHLCYSIDDVKKAFSSLINQNNVFGQVIEGVLAQEMLIGREYMVNTVSYGEDISFTEIIYVNKLNVNGAPIYDYSEIILPTDERANLIEAYVREVLPAMGFRYGAAHTEVIINAENEVVLVELNARLIGAYHMMPTTEALGYNHVSELIATYLDPRHIKKSIQSQYEAPRKRALTSFFITRVAGTVVKKPDVTRFKELEHYCSMKFTLHKGSEVRPTSSLLDSYGEVNFVGEDIEELRKMHQQFRELEEEFFADLLEPSHSSASVLNVYNVGIALFIGLVSAAAMFLIEKDIVQSAWKYSP